LYFGDLNGSPVNHFFDVTIPGGKPSGPAVALFASETGAITGWYPGTGTPGGPSNISLFAQAGYQATDGAISMGQCFRCQPRRLQ
jgi:hypothetical protein